MKILVFDIGGTAIKYGICKDGQLISTYEIPTNANRGGGYILDMVKKKCTEIINEHKRSTPSESFDGIGISTAGQVNSENGSIIYANSNIPCYSGMELRKELENEFHIPVMVENDVNSAAIGEAIYGAGREFDSFLCLTYGTGVGGAIVHNKQIYHGSCFSAGEFGGIITHADVRLKGNDYLDGCYEHYASVTALVSKTSAYNPCLTNGREIFKHLDEPQILAIIHDWINEISIGLITLTHIFNPPCIILGGGIMTQPYIINALKDKFYPHIMPNFSQVKLVKAALGNYAGLLGIYYLTSEYCQNRNLVY